MSGNKDLRELTLEDMEKVSGGTEIQDHVEYWVKDHPCPKCGEKDANSFHLMSHAIFYAQIECLKCGEIFSVRMKGRNLTSDRSITPEELLRHAFLDHAAPIHGTAPGWLHAFRSCSKVNSEVNRANGLWLM